jgi:hypothetical protein
MPNVIAFASSVIRGLVSSRGFLLCFIALGAMGSICRAEAPRIVFKMPMQPVVSDLAILEAIAQVETGNKPSVRGRLGERTRFQILPATWRRYSTVPISRAAASLDEAERVARQHLQHIRSVLVARGIAQTVYNIAVAWNAGPDYARITRKTVDYASRVKALVYDAIVPGADKLTAQVAGE